MLAAADLEDEDRDVEDATTPTERELCPDTKLFLLVPAPMATLGVVTDGTGKVLFRDSVLDFDEGCVGGLGLTGTGFEFGGFDGFCPFGLPTDFLTVSFGRSVGALTSLEVLDFDSLTLETFLSTEPFLITSETSFPTPLSLILDC